MAEDVLQIRFGKAKHDLVNVIQALRMHTDLAMAAVEKCKGLCPIENCTETDSGEMCKKVCEQEKEECVGNLSMVRAEVNELDTLIVRYKELLWLMNDIAHDWYGAEQFHKIN